MTWIDSYKKELAQLKEVLKSKNKILVQHRDVDGSCCAAQLLKFYPDFKTLSIKDPFIPDNIIMEIIEQKPELLVFVDVGVDEHLDRIVKIKNQLKGAKIFLIDHHVIQNDLNKNGILHINPRFQDPEIYIPASLMVFHILKHMESLEKTDRNTFLDKVHGKPVSSLSWIACIGVISDYGHKNNKEFITECKKQYGKLLDAKELIDSRIGDSAKTIYSAIILKGEYGVKKSVDCLVKSEGFGEFEKNETLKGWRLQVDKEIDDVVAKCEKDKEDINGVVFCEIDSKLNMASIISNILTEKYQDKIVVVGKEVLDGWKVSIRGSRSHVSGKINLANSVKIAVEGIGYGGGHPQAAGAFTQDWEKFKERLLKEINRNQNTI